MLKKDLVKIFQKGRDLITSGGYIQQTNDAISDEEMLVLEENINEFWVFFEEANKKDIELGYLDPNQI